jgi:YD repeat-containing protein
MEDIRLLGATGFLQFCRQPGVQVTRLTWDELHKVTSYTDDKKTKTFNIPDLSEDDFKAILTGKGDQTRLRALFLENELKDFVDEYFTPETLAQIRIQDSDIEKFLKGKPEQTPEDIAKRLPTWLVDLKSAFMPKRAE